MTRRATGQLISNSIVWGYALLILAPMAWVISNAFRRQIDILQGKLISPVTLSNFEELLFSRQSDFLMNLFNSAVVATSATVIIILVASMAAFTLGRLDVPGWFKWGVLGWALLFNMLPTLTFIGSWYVMFANMGLHGTYFAIIITQVVIHLPLAIFLLMNFLDGIPNELLQAARMDGLSDAQTFRKIILPLLRGGLIATAALVFIFAWSDFAVALNLTSSSTMTAPVAISTYAQEYEIRYGEMAAGSVLSMLPALTLILIGQRFVVNGLLAGAVK